MACEVRLPSGVEIEASSVSGGADRTPSPGEAGLLTLKFKHAGLPDSILVQCQVVHILANGMGLSAQFSQLNRREQELLGRMVASGRAQVDELVAA